MAQEKTKEEFRTLWGARVLWPSDMSDDCMESAVTAAQKQLNELGLNPDKQGEGAQICENLKKYFDETWGHSWVVVLGKNFGSSCVHEQHKFLYFYIGQHAFMLYKVAA